MMKVSNRKIITRLANASFKANKTRNRIAIIAIALTTILFTSLFTIGIGMMESFQQQTMRQIGGSAHAVMKNITDEQFDAVKDHPLIKKIGYNKLIGIADNPEFLKRHVEIWYEDKTGAELRFSTPTTGKLPQLEGEIATDTKTLDLLGITHEIGQKVPLSYTLQGKTYTKSFTLSGYWESDPVFNTGLALVSKAFVDTDLAKIPYTYRENGDMTGTLNADIMFVSSANMEQKLEKVITDSGFSYHPDTSTTPPGSNGIEGNVNWGYLSSSMKMDVTTLISIIVAAVLIIFTGYLIIFNIFQISVIRDIKFYGLLKTIGTTSKQIRRIISKQAMLLSLIGIPVGLIFGFIIGKACLPIVFGAIQNSNENYASVSMNPVIFIGAALFSLITVWISIRKPGKMAGKVSPVEAVRYSGVSETKKRKSKKSTNGGKIHRMALSNLGRNMKRTMLVVLSLSLSLVLLNTVFTISKGIDMDKFMSKFVDTDFLIGHANYFNINNQFKSSDDALSESFIEAVKAQPGFEDGGRLYNNVNIGNCFIRYTGDNRIAWSGYEDLMPEGEQQKLDLYGLEDLPLSRLDIVEGELDLEKLATGRYIIEGLDTDDNGDVYWNTDRYNIGDKVQVTVDGETKEYEVLAKAKREYMTNTNRRSAMFTMYLPAKEYLNIVKEPVVMTYAYNVAQSEEQAMDHFVKEYTEKAEPTMNYQSKLTMSNSYNGLKNMIVNIGGILSLIVGLIGILNFINSMLTSIISRRQEFAVMKSIGMTERQLRKMVIYEGLYYAAATILVSLVLSMLFSYAVVGGVVGSMWFFTYKLTIIPLLLAYPALLVLSVVIPYGSFRSLNKRSVVERLRETV